MYWLLGLTFIHVVGEGGLGFYEAIRTGSLALLAFALESVIEGGAAFLAVRHLRLLADREQDHARRDRMLARWIGISFLLLGAYVVARAVYELTHGSQAEKSVLGLLLTVFATFGMPFVGYGKWKTARRLGSEGIACDARWKVEVRPPPRRRMLPRRCEVIDPLLDRLLSLPPFHYRGIARGAGV